MTTPKRFLFYFACVAIGILIAPCTMEAVAMETNIDGETAIILLNGLCKTATRHTVFRTILQAVWCRRRV